MAFNNPGSKLERAVWYYLILQGKGTHADTYTLDFSGDRNLPNRTIAGTAFTPHRPNRPEGTVQLAIEHHFPAIEQPNNPDGTQRVEKNDFVGSTYDSMTQGDAQSYNITADAITAAGRAMAVDDSNGSDAEQARFAADNADMANFRCDWIQQSSPFITRGKPNVEGSYWVEILHFTAFVSNAST